MATHDTAVVDPKATLGEGVEIGPFAVIGPHVTLDDGVKIGAHAVIDGHTHIGKGTVVHAQACIGGPPQDRGHDGSDTTVEIGQSCQIREHVTIHAGSSTGAGRTRVGDRTFVMAGAHIAHDCDVGSDVTIASTATLSAAVVVGDGAVIGSLAGLHPHVRVGRVALVGAGALCAQDVPPFTLAQGDRARLFGLNIPGLRQAGIEGESLRALKTAWRRVFTSGLALRTGVRQARDAVGGSAEVDELLDFLEATTRGVCRAAAIGG